MTAWLLMAFLVVAGLLLLFRGNIELLADMGTLEIVLVAAGLLMVAVYVVIILADERSRPLQAIRYLLIWTTIAVALVAGYGYREEVAAVLDRVAGELVPAGQTMAVADGEQGERAVRVRRRLDGHFAVRGTVNDQAMTMLVDTGASTVVLKPAEAERAGIDVGDLSYTVPVHTANGTAYAASVRLNSIAIGPLVIENVEALVAQPGSLKENLLGMSFLRRLRSYEFSKDFLTLRG
jgi:aspartyl protease family protein